MKVVVADTSPLNYLVQIGEVGILPELYGKIVIPIDVLVELSDSEAPITVRNWVRQLPAWIEIRSTNPHFSPAIGKRPSLMA